MECDDDPRFGLLMKAQGVLDSALADGRVELRKEEMFKFEVYHEAIESISQAISSLKKSRRTLETARGQLSLFEKPSTGEKVLFATDGDLVKIGRTSRSETKRLREYQTGNGRIITILAAIPGASERKLHERWGRHRVHGEWFRMDPEIMEFIRAWQLVETAF